jgi:hypothetical protein
VAARANQRQLIELLGVLQISHCPKISNTSRQPSLCLVVLQSSALRRWLGGSALLGPMDFRYGLRPGRLLSVALAKGLGDAVSRNDESAADRYHRRLRMMAGQFETNPAVSEASTGCFRLSSIGWRRRWPNALKPNGKYPNSSSAFEIVAARQRSIRSVVRPYF